MWPHAVMAGLRLSVLRRLTLENIVFWVSIFQKCFPIFYYFLNRFSLSICIPRHGDSDYHTSPALDYRCVLPCLVQIVLGIKPRALCMVGKKSTNLATSAVPQSFFFYFNLRQNQSELFSYDLNFRVQFLSIPSSWDHRTLLPSLTTKEIF